MEGKTQKVQNRYKKINQILIELLEAIEILNLKKVKLTVQCLQKIIGSIQERKISTLLQQNKIVKNNYLNHKMLSNKKNNNSKNKK